MKFISYIHTRSVYFIDIAVTLLTEDITKCPICSEPFTDARSLPCVHTFCMQCIAGYGHDKQPGDQMPCPVCSKEFTIPAETSLSGLAKNSFIEKLLQIAQILNSDEAAECEACENQTRRDSDIKGASKYCVECHQKLCDPCAKVHENFKMLRGHKLISLQDLKGLQGKELFRTSLPTVCQKHKDQTLTIFCNGCKMAVCLICQTTSHKKHDCSDIDDVIGNFRKQMTNDVDSLTAGIEKLEGVLRYVEQLKEDLHKYTSETEDAILHKADELQKRIEENKQVLISELGTKKRDVMKKLDTLSDDITRQIPLIANLKKYTGELSNKGSAGDVAREIGVLRDRTEELLNIDRIEWTRNHMESLNVSLTTSTLTTGNTENLIGKVVLEVNPKGQ
jgi:RING-type zinc-finger/B-box zinc finger